MSKYPINKEFFPFNHFKPPISKTFLKIAVPFMKTPKFINKDKALDVARHEIQSYDGEKVDTRQKSLTKRMKCAKISLCGVVYADKAGARTRN